MVVEDTEVSRRESGGTNYSSSIYADDGCRIHPSCLDCPLPLCVLDMPLKEQRTRARVKIIRHLRDAGLDYLGIVQVTGLKRGVVYTVLAIKGEDEPVFTENAYLQRIAWP